MIHLSAKLNKVNKPLELDKPNIDHLSALLIVTDDVDAQETHVLLITIGLIVLGVMLVIGAIVMYRKRRTREGKPTTGILSVFLCAQTYMFV